jgi:hypothetical protein
VTPIRLLHNPAMGPLPSALARRPAIETTFPDGGRCGRCGGGLIWHVWVLQDPDVREQDGVIDCSLTG